MEALLIGIVLAVIVVYSCLIFAAIWKSEK